MIALTRARTCALILFAALFSAVPAAAQVAVPSQLTVEEAIRIAFRNNPGHLQLSNDLAVRDAQIRAAYGALMPTVNVGVNFSSTYSETTSAVDEFGQPLTRPRAVVSKTSRASQSISIGGITLFDGGRQFRGISRQKTGRRQDEARIAAAENSLRSQVIRAYYQVVLADQQIELQRQLLSFSQSRLELIERQFEVAAAKPTDLIGARHDVKERERALADDSANARAQRLTLTTQLGMSGEPSFELVSDLPEAFDPATLDRESLVQRALSSHPQIRQSQAGNELAAMSLSDAKAQRLPSVSMSLPGYSWGATERGLYDAWGQFGAPNNSFSFGVSLGMPIFRGFSTTSAIRSAQASVQDARYQAEQQRLQIETQVRAQLIELDRAYRGLQLAQESADLAQMRLQLAQNEYREGAINYTNLQQIIQSNDQAQRQLVQARFNFLNARITLEERVGGPLDQDD
jgi:outer membrane protein